MHRRLVTILATAAVVSATLAACSPGDAGGTGADPNNQNQVEVMTPWTSGQEVVAYKGLISVLKSEHPSIQLINSSVSGAGGANVRTAIQARLDAGNPPDSFLAHTGAEIMHYAGQNDLQDLTALYSSTGLDKVVPDSLTATMRLNGKIYGIPVNVHRANLVWANSKLLTAAGIDPSTPPATVADWLTDLAKLRANGVEHPLALAEAFTQVELFESVLIANLGPVAYTGLFDGTTKWDDPKVAASVDEYGQLLDYANPGYDTIDWTAAVGLVTKASAAYTVIPDFANGIFHNAGVSTNTQYVPFATPGTDTTFDFFADSFTLPVGAAHETAARAWLSTVASVKGQTAFSLAEGSIPVRSDIDFTSFTQAQQSAMSTFSTAKTVPSLSQGSATSPAWLTAITKAVQGYGHDHKPTALLAALKTAADDGLK